MVVQVDKIGISSARVIISENGLGCCHSSCSSKSAKVLVSSFVKIFSFMRLAFDSYPVNSVWLKGGRVQGKGRKQAKEGKQVKYESKSNSKSEKSATRVLKECRCNCPTASSTTSKSGEANSVKFKAAAPKTPKCRIRTSPELTAFSALFVEPTCTKMETDVLRYPMWVFTTRLFW